MDDRQLGDLSERLDVVIAEREESFVALAADLIRFETVSGENDETERARHLDEIAKCLSRLKTEAERLGLAFRVHDKRAAVAEWKGSTPGAGSVGVATHVDVVPAGDGWTHPPFAGEIVDGYLWGRGTQDDKGPTAMTLSAIEALQAVGATPEKDVRLLVGTQEETGQWDDVDLLIEKGESCDVVVTPDGGFPVINGEKGMMDVELRASWAPAFPEEGQARFVSLVSGQRSNMVPDLAMLRLSSRPEDADAVDERLDMTARRQIEINTTANVEIGRAEQVDESGEIGFALVFRGKSAHGSHPDAGRNAALDALEFMLLLGGWSPALAGFAGFLHERARVFDASGFGCECRHEELGYTTANLGILGLDASGGRAVINVRFPLGLDIATVAERFAAVAAEMSSVVAIESQVVGDAREPLFVSPEEYPEFIGALCRAYETATGREANCHSIAGTTYAKAYPLAVAFGPTDGSASDEELAHQIDERIPIARHLENIKIYALAIALMADASV